MTNAEWAAAGPRLGWLERSARGQLIARLAGLRQGGVELDDGFNVTRHGDFAGELRAEVRVRRPRFYRAALLGGSLGAAEAYIRGDWDCDDLTSLFRLLARNVDLASDFDKGWARISSWTQRWWHWLRDNTRRGSRKNIHAHYDLGNDFFGLWLDETLAYSSGVFPSVDASLADASRAKFDLVCRKLDVRASDHLLEIGGGWGGFALHAAETSGCRVTTTTISSEQLRLARQRVRDAHREDQITVLQKDYRDLTGRFDKLVSIEMIEAVGHRHLDTFFRKCSELLRPEGSFLLQAIVMPESRHKQYLRSVDFIQRHVFPGGCLPSLASLLESVGRACDLRLVHMEDFAPHYAETLRRWRRNFESRLGEVRGLGYPESFIRLWRYYLCYCEAAFEERHIGVLQARFDKPGRRADAVPAGRAWPVVADADAEALAAPTPRV